MKRLFIFLLLFVLICSCATKDSDPIIKFKNRKIDLKPFVEGFPYTGFHPFYDAGRMFYYQVGAKTILKEVDLKGESGLEKGVPVSDIDFSGRNVWSIQYNKNDNHLYWQGDEINDEIINLCRLNPSNGEYEKLTDVPYIFGYYWDEGRKNIAYTARLGDKEERLGELRVLNLKTLEENVITADKPEFRFSWGTVSWQPDGKGIVTTVNRNADRTYGNLVYIDLGSKQWTLMTDPDKPRMFPNAYQKWLNDDECLYGSNEDGFVNIYSYNIKKKRSRQITRFSKDVNNVELIEIGKKKYIFAVLGDPIESEILLIDPRTAEIIERQKADLNLTLLDSQENRLLVESTSATVKFRIDEITVNKDGFLWNTKIDIPDTLKNQIVRSRVERIEYPAFDTDPATGKLRMLHAFLYHPRNPLPRDQQMVMIEAFYGGENRFNTQYQILADAGIYVLSPAPRGSYGYGREFEALNDGDLGGNEILDIIYAGRYISEKLGIPPNRVGVFGASHGGYATMRLMTFPGEVNRNRAHFNWGFGISHAGFSDIINFYEHCNIPDWVVLEAGDPKTETEKLHDRSPLYHAREMRGKLLLTHGTNDNRVPTEESIAMADSLEKYGKDVTLVEFEGQGHGVKGLANTVKRYKAWFDFLEKVE